MTKMPNFKLLIFLAVATLVSCYDVGITQNYKYETFVAISEDCEDLQEEENPVGHKLGAEVHLTAIWEDPQDPSQKLIKIQVLNTKLQVSSKISLKEHKSEIDTGAKLDSYFLLKNGRTVIFWDDPSEHNTIRNTKRSVASILQLKKEDGEEEELDVCGTCRVFYKTEGNTVRRSKFNCRLPIQDSAHTQPLSVRSQSVHQSTGIDCILKDGNVVSKCMATERAKTVSNLWEKASACIQTTSQLSLEKTFETKEAYKGKDFKSVIEEITKKYAGKLVEGNIVAILEESKKKPNQKVLQAMKSFQDSIKTSNLAKLKSVSAFFKLLPAFQTASEEEILELLKNKKFRSVLPQIMDLLAASSTKNSINAVFKYFKDEKDYNEILERYLISLSVTSHPDAFILKEVKAFLEKDGNHEKIKATLITTLGALLGTYTKLEHRTDEKVVQEILDHLENSLKKCNDDECISTYLRGLRNAAQLASLPVLLHYAEKGGKSALEAVLAIRNIQHMKLTQEIETQLLRILHQVGTRQDRSTRSVVAEILLTRSSSDAVLKNVLEVLSDQSDAEFSTFVASKVLHLMEGDKRLRSKLVKVLSEKEIGHYFSLSQKGKSSLFKRQLIGTDSLNVTYGIEMELLEGGLLKRSAFDVDFESRNGNSNLLSVVMFAQGMASFAGGESSEAEEGLDPTAGMELSLLGTSLRPYIFFSSTSELMGHAWSGTASELTPALQGIFSLGDDTRLVVLHNGMLARMEIKGAMSADLSAAIQISIWSRNSQSQVKNAAALLYRGSAVVDTPAVQTRGEYLYYGQSAINFSTELDFAETPFKMCFQMEHPPLQLKHDFQKSVEITGSGYSLKKSKKRKKFISSRSFMLHPINNELCRIMKSSY